MKKFIVRLLCIPFIPIIALCVGDGIDYTTGRKIGFIRAVRMMWQEWWSD